MLPPWLPPWFPFIGFNPLTLPLLRLHNSTHASRIRDQERLLAGPPGHSAAHGHGHGAHGGHGLAGTHGHGHGSSLLGAGLSGEIAPSPVGACFPAFQLVPTQARFAADSAGCASVTGRRWWSQGGRLCVRLAAPQGYSLQPIRLRIDCIRFESRWLRVIFLCDWSFSVLDWA